MSLIECPRCSTANCCHKIEYSSLPTLQMPDGKSTAGKPKFYCTFTGR